MPSGSRIRTDWDGRLDSGCLWNWRIALCKKTFSLSHTHLLSEKQRETAEGPVKEKPGRDSRSGGQFIILKCQSQLLLLLLRCRGGGIMESQEPLPPPSDCAARSLYQHPTYHWHIALILQSTGIGLQSMTSSNGLSPWVLCLSTRSNPVSCHGAKLQQAGQPVLPSRKVNPVSMSLHKKSEMDSFKN